MRPVKWQRNKIFEAVAAGGLDPKQCTFDYEDSGARVSHSPSGSHFLLEGDPSRYISTAVVGDNPSWSSDAFSWMQVEERVQRWAREVKDDFDTPDLWAELQRQREIITVSRYADAENTPFTVNERAEIAQQLGQIKDLIRETHSLTEAQMLSLETTFEDAVAAAGRIGRKDWQLLFLGQMFGVIVTRVLPSEAVQDLIVKVVNALGHLFGGWGGPPSLPPMA